MVFGEAPGRREGQGWSPAGKASLGSCSFPGLRKGSISCCCISSDGCVHLTLKIPSRVEILTPSSGDIPRTTGSTLPFRAGDTTLFFRGGSPRVGHPHVPSGSGWASSGPGWAAVALTPLFSLARVQKVAYTTVLQEWLRLACRSDAHPELVRRHLVTFRAMSARLLDYVVNIADSNGNTALHYSVSHANFPVVRQLLDSGEPWGRGQGAPGGQAGCHPV